VGLFPGALELLEDIPGTYRRALLSNSNVLHWPRVLEDMKLGAAFEHHFVSHLTGRIKPDEDAFLHVTESLDCRPGEVLFLDDNQLNVDAAARVGMHARRVLGPGAARSTLADFGVLPHPPGAPA
jgi:putative hydrolase of the HAD superfamily